MTAAGARIAQSFARGMPSYDRAATAQRRIAKALFDACRRLAPEPPRRVFEAGYGSGHLTRHLAGLRPERLWLNDLVAPPLPGVRATYLPGDIARARLPQALDLVASASMIQWVARPAEVLDRLCAAVAPGGVLALSGYAPDHFPELRALGSRAGAPSCLDGAAIAALLPPGWRPLGCGEWRIALHFPDALAVLRHLRATGVNGRAGQFRSRGALQDFLARYEAAHGGPQGVTLTYVASWLVARKQPPTSPC
ncbi:malonyl-CoA O-methyltransferase [Paracoccus aminovorans]|uniref:Malonyl-CoA O-methyltransferase n=1 Tax=Paracoccus aminovorans TaxID=34004 RepID=A0A1I2Z471_9RHOB|nr:methyltransferase domain-containing protein [Paracoccus aminovorans]CQR83954.1 biotin synthesis protein [Paracoccus aminovorans]SFH32375.1 malonyl-CoA O-methyltransferase [Paracoccus aminovorans]